VRLWEAGHRFDEIDSMALTDLGDILGVWNERALLEESNRRRKNGV